MARVVEELQRLKAERDELPALVEEAAAAFDQARREELEQRARSLEARSGAAQARLFRLYAERAGARLPEAEQAATAARAEYERAHAVYLEAYARTNRLGVEADNARARALSLKQAVEENERRARELSRRTPAAPSGAREGRP